MKTIKTQVLRTNGASEEIEIPKGSFFDELKKVLNCSTFDVVNLRDGRVMIVNDLGYETRAVEKGVIDGFETVEVECVKPLLPVNDAATKLYHGVCVPGTTHQIVGDVAIVLDAEMGDD